MPYYGYYGGYGDFFANNIYCILLIPVLLLSLWAQAQVSGNFKRYSGVANRRRLTGAQAAEEPLGVPAGDVGTAGDGENHGESPRKKRADSTAVRPLCQAAAPVCGTGEAEGSAGTAELPLAWLVMV